MKKKFLTLILTLSIATSISACGGNKSKETPPKEEIKKEIVSNKDELSEYVGKSLTETMEKISALGYTAKYFADGVDFTEFIDSVKDDYLIGDIKEDSDAKTVEVTLILATNSTFDELEAQLSENLEVGSAWSAAEKYGKTQYGNEFELNYLIGKIDAAAEDENTWFLKAECKINDEDKTCEATVTGTTASPEVISFNVY